MLTVPPQRPYWHAIAKTASYAIQGIDSQAVFTNTGATSNITLTLPKAAPGLYLKFCVTAAHQITVAPKTGTDTIRGKVAGASVSNSTAGSFLSLICVVAGYWEPEVNVGAWA